MKLGKYFFSTNIKDFYTFKWYKKEEAKSSGDVTITVNVYPIIAGVLLVYYFIKKK